MVGLNILWFVLILMVLVLVHEAGHMVVAKWCGMRVERFSIFFGRPIASFRRGETEYAIGWIPAGGYVKISGMAQWEEMDPEHEHRAYHRAKTWKRVATIFAGPAVNIVLAFLIFAVTFWIGVRAFGEPTSDIAVVNRDSPAAAAGLRPGDRLLAVNEVRAGGDAETVRAELQSNPGRSVRITFARGEETIVRTTPPLTVQEVDGRQVGLLGIQFQQPVTTRSFGFAGGLDQGARFTWYVLEENGRFLGRVFTSEEARSEVSSVVGVGAVFNEVSDDGLVTILRLVGLLSLALGIFNLLPILPLDGGHIVFALIEKVRGSPISRRAYERTAVVGFALVMLVFVVALQNDIGRLTGEGFQIQR